MSRDPIMTDEIKKKMALYEPKLKNCIKTGDAKVAEKYITRIQNVLKDKGYQTRLAKDKNLYFETLIEAGFYTRAISGLIGNRNKVSKNSRIYLESTSLLAIAYIKNNEINIAQKYIDETILKINNISTDSLRREFHSSFLERIQDEILLNKLIGTGEELDNDEVHKLSVELVQTRTEDEIYEILGNYIPEETVQLLLTAESNNILMISAEDRKYLPKPISTKDKKDLGKKFNSAIKRVVWKGLCDPKSDIYKAWSDGLSIVHDKKYLTVTVVSLLNNLKIGTMMVAASIVALAIRFGVGVFCEMFEPESIMEKRKTR